MNTPRENRGDYMDLWGKKVMLASRSSLSGTPGPISGDTAELHSALIKLFGPPIGNTAELRGVTGLLVVVSVKDGRNSTAEIKRAADVSRDTFGRCMIFVIPESDDTDTTEEFQIIAEDTRKGVKNPLCTD